MNDVTLDERIRGWRSAAHAEGEHDDREDERAVREEDAGDPADRKVRPEPPDHRLEPRGQQDRREHQDEHRKHVDDQPNKARDERGAKPERESAPDPARRRRLPCPFATLVFGHHPRVRRLPSAVHSSAMTVARCGGRVTFHLVPGPSLPRPRLPPRVDSPRRRAARELPVGGPARAAIDREAAMGDEHVVQLHEVTIEGDPEAGKAYVDGENAALYGVPSHLEDVDNAHIDSYAEGYLDKSAELKELDRQDALMQSGPTIGPGQPGHRLTEGEHGETPQEKFRDELSHEPPPEWETPTIVGD
jgi:hypothetical protein